MNISIRWLGFTLVLTMHTRVASSFDSSERPLHAFSVQYISDIYRTVPDVTNSMTAAWPGVTTRDITVCEIYPAAIRSVGPNNHSNWYQESWPVAWHLDVRDIRGSGDQRNGCRRQGPARSLHLILKQPRDKYTSVVGVNFGGYVMPKKV